MAGCGRGFSGGAIEDRGVVSVSLITVG